MGASTSTKFLLPEHVLDFQRCTRCRKYLSCPPTKVFSTGDIICGRCSTLIQYKASKNRSIYEKIAKNTLFPCVNRYEGCSDLLEYDKVLDHEKQCLGMLYNCPTCVSVTNNYLENTLLYLTDHYKKCHKKLYLTEPVIKVSLETQIEAQKYLFPSLNYLFLISVSYKDQTLILSVSIPGKNRNRVLGRVKLFEHQSDYFYESLWKPCGSFDFDMATKDKKRGSTTNNMFVIDVVENCFGGDYFWCQFEFEFSEKMTKLE